MWKAATSLIMAVAAAAPGASCAPRAARPSADATAAVPQQPGVSLALARHRAATLSHIRYVLDLDVTAADRVDGVVFIELQRTGRADLVLDFRGTALGGVEANGAAVPDARWDGHHIRVPARQLVQGTNTLRLAFTSTIAAAGAPVISYDDADDDARYLYTLLVPADAQLLFPVFDQPDLKARFLWRIITPAGWRVLTNAPRAAANDLHGRVRHVFEETAPISTYTAALAAGPWAVLPPRPLGADNGAADSVADVMTLWVRRSRAAEVDSDTLLAINREALHWLERYFDMRYPYAKLDLLLAPAFPFGGMEHAGAIFYNESSFIFREPPSLSRRLGRTATIYHEMAHQWFGNLVTMRWFDDLWLKEGFSTFIAAKMQAELQPESGAWTTFHLRNKPAAYRVDATAGTTPLWQELANLDLAAGNYGAIVYSKAPAVLKQLEFLIGEEAFRRGMQIFLRRHAWGNADWRDLLAAMSEASGRNLRTFGRHYVLRAGLPVVETDLRLTDGGRIGSLSLVQRPARSLPGDAAGAWPARVRVRLGYVDREDVVIDVTLSGSRTTVPRVRGLPAPAFVFANDGDYGYGIFLPDFRSAAWFLQHAGGIGDDLLRTLAWGATWEMVREGRLAPDLFATAALAALRSERDEQIGAALLARVAYALEHYLAEGTASARLAVAMEELLLRRIDSDSLDYGHRRTALDAFLASARSERGVRVLKAYLRETRDFDGGPLGQPSRWAAVTRLLALDDPEAPALFAAERRRDDSPEAARMAFIAGAALPTAENKSTYFERYLTDASLNEEWVTASLAAFNQPLHEELTIDWLPRALEASIRLRDTRRIFFLPRWLDAFIGGHASPAALQIVDDFLAGNTELPADVRRRILQARDELERAVQIRAGTSAMTGPPT